MQSPRAQRSTLRALSVCTSDPCYCPRPCRVARLRLLLMLLLLLDARSCCAGRCLCSPRLFLLPLLLSLGLVKWGTVVGVVRRGGREERHWLQMMPSIHFHCSPTQLRKECEILSIVATTYDLRCRHIRYPLGSRAMAVVTSSNGHPISSSKADSGFQTMRRYFTVTRTGPTQYDG